MSSTNQTAAEEGDGVEYHRGLAMYPEFNRYQYEFYKDFAEADGI